MHTETALITLPAHPLPAVQSRAERLLRQFLSGKKETTLRAYANDLEDFSHFCNSLTVADAIRALLAYSKGEATELVMSYRDKMLDRGLKAATVNRRLAALRSLVALACEFEMVPWTIKVKNLKAAPYRDTRGPGRNGYLKLLLSIDERHDDVKGLRDRAILRMLYGMALRRAEVASLDMTHLDLGNDRIFVMRKGKDDREPRTIPAEAKTALLAWLQTRGAEAGPLFLSMQNGSKGERLTPRGVYAVVTELGKKTGQRVTPHGLRHASITDALELTNGNLIAVAKFSGHAKLDTVRIYDDNRRDVAGDVARLVDAATRTN